VEGGATSLRRCLGVESRCVVPFSSFTGRGTSRRNRPRENVAATPCAMQTCPGSPCRHGLRAEGPSLLDGPDWVGDG
jgi:hypothetical protein